MVYSPPGWFTPKCRPTGFPKEFLGKQVVYCPECGWWTEGATSSCQNCDHRRLRFWGVEAEDLAGAPQ